MNRLVVSEYGPFETLDSYAVRFGFPTETLENHLKRVGLRISNIFKITNPIQFRGDQFRVVDVAGLIRLAPQVELEIVPKFLSQEDPRWREDFFAVATIARFGRVLPMEALTASVSRKTDLADLVGHAMVTMYDNNQAHPIRIYRQRTWKSHEIDGEIDSESVLRRDEEGFLQSGIVLDRQNQYNWIIHQAMGKLLPEIRDGDIRRQVTERYRQLSPQTARPRLAGNKRSLPSRHRRWEDLFNLSKGVCRGFGSGYSESGSPIAPGYLTKTESAWESLLFIAIRSGMQNGAVAKEPISLGVRYKSDGTAEPVSVTPDITIKQADRPRLIVDAKYRTRFSDSAATILRIDRADLYESLAFLEATGIQHAILLYPTPSKSQGSGAVPCPGKISEFERIAVETRVIHGLTVDVRGISSPGGFRRFTERLSEGLRAMLPNPLI